jgi:hypothetical protein
MVKVKNNIKERKMLVAEIIAIVGGLGEQKARIMQVLFELKTCGGKLTPALLREIEDILNDEVEFKDRALAAYFGIEIKEEVKIPILIDEKN